MRLFRREHEEAEVDELQEEPRRGRLLGRRSGRLGLLLILALLWLGVNYFYPALPNQATVRTPTAAPLFLPNLQSAPDVQASPTHGK